MHFFKCVVNGVNELQALGIFHADLCFRNVLSFRKEEHRVYKIIDFDYCFKVRQTDNDEKLFCLTRNIFRILVEQDHAYTHSIFYHLFRNIYLIQPELALKIK